MRSPWPVPIVALTPASCGAVLWRAQGAERLTVVVKATFALVHDRSAELAAPADLSRADRLRDGSGSLEDAGEIAPYLPRAGVLVRGHAAAPAGTTTTALSVRVALFREDRWVLDKVLHVYGDRTREAPSPRPFSLMPLVYERAYGGPQTDANPVGVGAGTTLPNIVDPADPTRPTGVGPIAGSWAPRRGLLAPDHAPDLSALELGGSFDFRYFVAAPADQQLEFLRGDEWILLEGLHPHCQRIQSCLPSARGLARIHRLGPGCDDLGQPIELVADTLTIDADRLLCSLIWRGNVALLPDDAPARMRVVAGVEVPGRPVPWPSAPWPSAPWPSAGGPSAGEGLVAIAAPEGAPAAEGTALLAGHWSVVTQQVAPLLSPPPLPFSRPQEAHWSVVTQQVAPLLSPPPLPFSRPQEAHWSAVTQQVPPLLSPPPLPFLPAPELPSRPEAPPASVPFAMPFAHAGPEASPPEPPARVQPPLAGLDETQPGVDQPPPHAQPPAPHAQPPAAPDGMAVVAEQPPPHVEPPPPAPDEAAALAEQPPPHVEPPPPAPDEAAAPAEQPPPHVEPPPPAPDEAAAPAEQPPFPAAAAPEPEARGLRAAVLARLRSGQPLYDLELAGAELEGIDWSGASLERLNLAGAALARCNFASARLARANLSGADLTDANLQAADLTRADLSRAMLDRAALSSAILTSADLTSARGSQARFDGAALDGADLRQARLFEAVFDRASLADVNASKADLSRSSFANANLAGAILRAAKLKEARLPCANVDGADLREADLAGANLYGVKLANAKSSGAILREVVEIPPPEEDINVSSQG
ncbi:DUF2169 domain-containing protein [Sorangium sp. So ce375]|uniref:DUF2169 family type VI secretion system accessory protein n=1 Tax=Sorangium sp. So ce375 TaxID=3133306 RepID=UPI003F5B66A8